MIATIDQDRRDGQAEAQRARADFPDDKSGSDGGY
jgi:hypothetical protein